VLENWCKKKRARILQHVHTKGKHINGHNAKAHHLCCKKTFRGATFTEKQSGKIPLSTGSDNQRIKTENNNYALQNYIT
jgi:hypothetical protein